MTTPILAGWKLVPIEPTPEMIKAWHDTFSKAVIKTGRSNRAYAAMLRAVTGSPASVAPGDAQDKRQAFDRLPAYITDDRYHLQYRLGWNDCLADCRAAILADAPAAGDALDEPVPEWASCESRGPWVTNSLKANAQELRDKEKRCRRAFNKDFMGVPSRYVADAYAEAATVFEAKLAALAAQVPQQGEA